LNRAETNKIKGDLAMTEPDAHEVQALIRYHCAAIVETIDGGGLRPSKHEVLQSTARRIAELINDLERCLAQTKG
jgi:hypothetical protein